MLLFSLRPPTDTKLRATGRARHNNIPILGLEELPVLDPSLAMTCNVSLRRKPKFRCSYQHRLESKANRLTLPDAALTGSPRYRYLTGRPGRSRTGRLHPHRRPRRRPRRRASSIARRVAITSSAKGTCDRAPSASACLIATVGRRSPGFRGPRKGQNHRWPANGNNETARGIFSEGRQMYPASSFGDILGTFFGRGGPLLRREK
jgi:hypothetical protein